MSTDDQADPRGVQRNRPVHVDALASTVISVLRDRQSLSCEGLRQFVVDHLFRAILAKDAFYPDQVLDVLQGYRLTVDLIIDRYVPAVARLLGDRWVSDDINFAEVTIGALRLQSLLVEASEIVRYDPRVAQESVNALVVVPQGEQHFLGASVLLCQLRRMGCDVATSFDEDFTTLVARLKQDTPDIVLITCSRPEALESIAQTVQIIHEAGADRPMIALGGAIKLDEREVIERTGVDIVTCAASDAIAFLKKSADTPRSS